MSPGRSFEHPRPFEAQTIEAWAASYILTTDLAQKRSPPPVPACFADADAPVAAPSTPGRPAELTVVAKVARSGYGTKSEEARARTLHTFLHHELQAAELMAWALLRFRDTEVGFRKGLLAICLDEIRHLGLYVDLLAQRGVTWGAYPVRDWFWQRVPTCQSPLQFVSLMGLGVEAANLEHAARFADEFERHGDLEAAQLQRVVLRDEIAHVAFGRHWFERWRGALDFGEWKAALPPPLSPLLMRGLPLNVEARRAAGLDPPFLDALSAWTPDDDPRD